MAGELIGDQYFRFGLLEESDIQSHAIDRIRRAIGRGCGEIPVVQDGDLPGRGRIEASLHQPSCKSDEKKCRQQGGAKESVPRVEEELGAEDFKFHIGQFLFGFKLIFAFFRRALNRRRGNPGRGQTFSAR